MNLTEIGDAMVANGLRAVGYEYVNLGALANQGGAAGLWEHDAVINTVC